MEIKKLKLSELEPNAGQIPGLPMNPRQWTKSDVDKLARSLKETPELFEARPIIAFPYGGKYVILGGNMRYEASKVNKAEAVPVVVFPAATSIDKLKEVVIKDNGAFGAWDWDMLANEWDDLPLVDWGVPTWEIQSNDEPINAEEGGDNYSRKIEAPIYEPTGEEVEISECYDKKKYDNLLQAINGANVPPEVKDFLRLAATRHIVFDYAKIADFYSNADAETQRLMEDSALVIIDFDKAIENGFVKMTEELSREYARQKDED